jgi:hypothetical protein
MLVLIPVINVVLIHYALLRLHLQKHIVAQLHPVERQFEEAHKAFATRLHRQSTTLAQATREYHRRYRRAPPPNFDVWYTIAQYQNFTLVDEFDSLMRALEPLWGVPPSTLRSFVSQALENHRDFLLRYDVREGHLTIEGGSRNSWFAEGMGRLLPSEWLRLLPDMALAINVFDEPSVCVPRDSLDEAMRRREAGHNLEVDAAEDQSVQPQRFLDIGKQNAWEAMKMSCPITSAARRSFCATETAQPSLPFIANITQSKDICSHCELQNMEGFLISPESLHLTHSLVPIWSQAKPALFNDLILPSPYYIVRANEYVEDEDPDWDSKEDELYWVGAATGGHMTDTNWMHLQRQRLTMMTQDGSQLQTRLLRKQERGPWVPYDANISDVASLFSTRIVGTTGQCEYAACTAQKETFGIGFQEVKDGFSTAYAHKILLDMDGNSFSGRFHRLLRSKSMVIKQTLFQEWHDDRLMPWVHYVPVTTSFEELPEMVRYLLTEQSGKEIARQIAEESRMWASKALREVDMQLVWLRLLLEYGRLVDPDRDYN